jgi:LacI family transcriptional regulator
VADPDWLFVGSRAVEGGREMAHALVERFPDQASRPTAVVAFNDRTAVGVLRGFYELGIRVPDEMAVVGFHGLASGRYTTPALTSIDHPRVELGELAAESLFTLLEGGGIDVRDRIVPVSLVVRESCGARLSEARRTLVAAAGIQPTDGQRADGLVGSRLSGGEPGGRDA